MMKNLDLSFEETQFALTAYLHEQDDSQSTDHRPAVLVLPGGGYYIRAQHEGEPVALSYLAQGFQSFVLHYPVGAEHSFEDAYNAGVVALSFLRERSLDFGINPQQIAVVGFSAGGHLASALSTLPKSPANAAVLGYPVILGEFGDSIQKELPSMQTKVTASTASTFLFATQGDSAVPIDHSLQYLAALAQYKVPFESHIFFQVTMGLVWRLMPLPVVRYKTSIPILPNGSTYLSGFCSRYFGFCPVA